jgi:hypothetical protein
MTDAATQILNDLKTAFGTEFKAYFFGDPFAIPISLLPCIIVDLNEETQALGPTGFDRNSQSISVRVVLNKRDDFGGDTSMSLTKQRLKNYMSARDATTKQYVEQSVLGVIRQYLTLNAEIENQTGRINYGISDRSLFTTSEKQAQLTSEAELTITTSELVQIDNRS